MSHGMLVPELAVLTAGFLTCLCQFLAVTVFWGQVMCQEEEISPSLGPADTSPWRPDLIPR